MTPVRLEPAVPRSPAKHSTTEPLRSLQYSVNINTFVAISVHNSYVLELISHNNTSAYYIFSLLEPVLLIYVLKLQTNNQLYGKNFLLYYLV